MKDKKTGSGGRLAGIVIAISIVLLAAVMPAVVSRTIPAYENTCLGWRPLTVRTNSMEGAIRKNALVIVYAARWDDLKVNDVITFQRPDGRLDTHRVISKDGAHIVTKGDNAAAPDAGWITPDNYKYKVVFVWNWMAWVSDHRGAAYLVCLPPLLVMLAAIGVFFVRRVGKWKEPYMESAPVGVEAVQPPIAPQPAPIILPDDTRVSDTQAAAEDDGSLAWIDEMILLLDDKLKRPRGKATEEKEKPNVRKNGQAYAVPAAGDDSDLDWDDWALLQLRRPAASPGDALPAIG